MRIGIIGGTGKQGSGLAMRWARAGHTIAIGSRDPEKASAHACALAKGGHGALQGSDYVGAAQQAEVVVLTVPYGAHASTLATLRDEVGGKVVIDMTVPLVPPAVSRVHLPKGQAAALEAQALLDSRAPVAAALHHVSSAHLSHPLAPIECDVLVASDDARAKATTFTLVRDLGLRPLDAGPLVNAIALESLTCVLIHLNRIYKSTGAGVVFTNLPGAPPPPIVAKP